MSYSLRRGRCACVSQPERTCVACVAVGAHARHGRAHVCRGRNARASPRCTRVSWCCARVSRRERTCITVVHTCVAAGAHVRHGGAHACHGRGTRASPRCARVSRRERTCVAGVRTCDTVVHTCVTVVRTCVTVVRTRVAAESHVRTEGATWRNQETRCVATRPYFATYRIPTIVAVRKFASVPASMARRPSRARSPRREGASEPMPPIWMAIEEKFAKPQSA